VFQAKMLPCSFCVWSPTFATRLTYFFHIQKAVKVNQSHYRPEIPEGSRKLRFPGYMTMAEDVGKVVSLTHQPLLPPGNTPGTHFC